ncbi:MAG: J domain-containing protein [Phycisphaerae bacterium]|nr:J domain-containing protein [Phycisphaerae bacterium]
MTGTRIKPKQSPFARQYRALGLSPDADLAQLQQAFRELVRKHHPDVNPHIRGHDRFVEIVEAYRVLRERMEHAPDDENWGQCPKCRHYRDLFDPLGNGRCCAECLLSAPYRGRMLPGPVLKLARHLGVIGAYGAAVLFTTQFVATQTPLAAFAAIGLTLFGLGLLAYEVITA